MAKQLVHSESPFETKMKRVAPWVGWYRGHGRWRVVCEAPTNQECWRLLMSHRDPTCVESERCVLRAGMTPPTRSREEEW
jgi:hypothetical protein